MLRFISVVMLAAALHLALMPLQPALAAPSVHQELLTVAQLLNGLGTPAKALEVLRQAGKKKEADQMQRHLASGGASLEERFPAFKVEGNKVTVEGGKPIFFRSLKPLIFHYRGHSWNYEPGKDTEAQLKSLESFFSEQKKTGLLDLFVPSAFANDEKRGDGLTVRQGRILMAGLIFSMFVIFGWASIGENAVFSDISLKSALSIMGIGAAGLAGMATMAFADTEKMHVLPVKVEGCDPFNADPDRKLKITYHADGGHTASAEVQMNGYDPVSVTTTFDGQSRTYHLVLNKAGNWQLNDQDVQELEAVLKDAENRKTNELKDPAILNGMIALGAAGSREMCSDPRTREELMKHVAANVEAVRKHEAGEAAAPKEAETGAPVKPAE
jgi:hypothetical protein